MTNPGELIKDPVEAMKYRDELEVFTPNSQKGWSPLPKNTPLCVFEALITAKQIRRTPVPDRDYSKLKGVLCEVKTPGDYGWTPPVLIEQHHINGWSVSPLMQGHLRPYTGIVYGHTGGEMPDCLKWGGPFEVFVPESGWCSYDDNRMEWEWEGWIDSFDSENCITAYRFVGDE